MHLESRSYQQWLCITCLGHPGTMLDGMLTICRSLISAIQLISFAANTITQGIWLKISKIIGKKATVQICCVGWGLALIPSLFIPASTQPNILLWIQIIVVSGFGSPVGNQLTAMLGDTVDYDQLLWFGTHRMESSYVSI